MHTSGTATTLVSSSQQDSTRPSVPCGMGTRLASSASAPLACGQQQVCSARMQRSSLTPSRACPCLSVDHAAALCDKLQGSKAPCHRTADYATSPRLRGAPQHYPPATIIMMWCQRWLLMMQCSCCAYLLLQNTALRMLGPASMCCIWQQPCSAGHLRKGVHDCVHARIQRRAHRCALEQTRARQ